MGPTGDRLTKEIFMTNHTPKMNNLNNFKQPEALRIAIKLEREWTNDALNYDTAQEAWTELRRLYAEVDSLSYRLAYPDNFLKEPEQEPVAIADGTFNHTCPVGTLLYTSPLAQRKPLTDEQKTRMWQKEHEKESRRAAFDWYFQGIADSEAAHGIKGDA